MGTLNYGFRAFPFTVRLVFLFSITLVFLLTVIHVFIFTISNSLPPSLHQFRLDLRQFTVIAYRVMVNAQWGRFAAYRVMVNAWRSLGGCIPGHGHCTVGQVRCIPVPGRCTAFQDDFPAFRGRFTPLNDQIDIPF